MNVLQEKCRLCEGGSDIMGMSGPENRVFLLCQNCKCVFVSGEQLPDESDEKARYLLHKNERTKEYEEFLNRLAGPVIRTVPSGSEGLDFGCGPVPVLSELLGEQGFKMHHYDPFFFPDKNLLARDYDFVVCSETAEHFHDPGREFDLLNRLVKPGGHLGVMTQMRPQWEGFFDWHYPRDPTHVVFYSPRTMRWLAQKI